MIVRARQTNEMLQPTYENTDRACSSTSGISFCNPDDH